VNPDTLRLRAAQHVAPSPHQSRAGGHLGYDQSGAELRHEAAVRPVALPERGTLYRVRLGPYQSLDDATRIKATLSQNGVGAAIIRTTDEAKNP